MHDIFVIGGGVNGVAIARDAAGRGLKVALADKGDLAGETSSKSTKLYHGGLRYLEYLEFSLVRESLREREVLLKNMPHISRPLRFVLPYEKSMRFDDDSPVSKWTGRLMPWTRGRRPQWMIRSGLFLYDHMGGRDILKPTEKIELSESPEGKVLKAEFEKAYEYSDCWVDDSRLVALTARDAKARGAQILTHTKITKLSRGKTFWVLGDEYGNTHQAKMVINAAGPWVENVARAVPGYQPKAHVKLVRGSHIVVPKLYDHDKAYFFNGTDGRIIFAIPFEQEFTLIGTTEATHEDPDFPAFCTQEELDYLCEHASVYFKKPVQSFEVVWSFSGVRPLYDDGAKSATAATREYVLTMNEDQAPILNVFGGKITTHRVLAEEAMTKISKIFPKMGAAWTQKAPLSGGKFQPHEAYTILQKMKQDYAFMKPFTVTRLFRAYGLDVYDIFGDVTSWRELGTPFGHGLSQREVDHLVQYEFARNAEDVLWRRTKLGLHFNSLEVRKLDEYIQTKF